jgi:hypothetical protein
MRAWSCRRSSSPPRSVLHRCRTATVVPPNNRSKSHSWEPNSKPHDRQSLGPPPQSPDPPQPRLPHARAHKAPDASSPPSSSASRCGKRQLPSPLPTPHPPQVRLSPGFRRQRAVPVRRTGLHGFSSRDSLTPDNASAPYRRGKARLARTYATLTSKNLLCSGVEPTANIGVNRNSRASRLVI